MRDKTRLKMNRKGYIGTMTQLPKGPVASEIEQRLQSALSPVHLAVINDSAKHSGHMGDDGSGASHFTVEIVAEAFVGQSRVSRQHMVKKVLEYVLSDQVHALAIKATDPGDTRSGTENRVEGTMVMWEG